MNNNTIKTWYNGYEITYIESAKAESQWYVANLPTETKSFASLKAAKMAIGRATAEPKEKDTKTPFNAFIITSKGYSDRALAVKEVTIINLSQAQHRIYFRPVGWTLGYRENGWVDVHYSDECRIHLTREAAEKRIEEFKEADKAYQKAQTAKYAAESNLKGIKVETLAKKLNVPYSSNRY